MSSAPDPFSTPDPSRRVTYRWISGACRRNSSVNSSGSVREHPMRSASLRGICPLSGGIGGPPGSLLRPPFIARSAAASSLTQALVLVPAGAARAAFADVHLTAQPDLAAAHQGGDAIPAVEQRGEVAGARSWRVLRGGWRERGRLLKAEPL